MSARPGTRLGPYETMAPGVPPSPPPVTGDRADAARAEAEAADRTKDEFLALSCAANGSSSVTPWRGRLK